MAQRTEKRIGFSIPIPTPLTISMRALEPYRVVIGNNEEIVWSPRRARRGSYQRLRVLRAHRGNY
jgi:hypothetical protein